MLDGPQDIPKHQALLLGVLPLGPQQWIHRRVEQVSYIDASTVRRRISIDFEVPDGSIVRDAPGPVYVPIAQLAKRSLSRFDLRDSDGCSLPMVTRDRLGKLTAVRDSRHTGLGPSAVAPWPSSALNRT